MSKTFRMTITPMEPYFFGNEKTFLFDTEHTGGKNRYFIKSEAIPLQTTILGSLRYLLMPVKHHNFSYTEDEAKENASVIGEESFDIRKKAQAFGAIRKISPVFLIHGAQYYVHTPLDHKTKLGQEDALHYAPFENYSEELQTNEGTKIVPMDYTAKDGLADSYICIHGTTPGKIIASESIFEGVVRVGQNKARDKKAFFKKQYCRMSEGWSFAAYVSLNMDVLGQNAEDIVNRSHIVYMGQNKTAFRVQFVPEEDTLKTMVARLLRPNVFYLLSDSYVPSQVYKNCLFAAVNLRDYRAYFTRSEKGANGRRSGKITKGDQLYKLITAGSVLIPKDAEAVIRHFENQNCNAIGFNIIANKEDAKNESSSI